MERRRVHVMVWAAKNKDVIGGGVRVLPTHTGLALGPVLGWEMALVRNALPRALRSLGLGRHQRMPLACADRGFHCPAGQTQEGLGGSSKASSPWVQEMSPCCV